MTTIRRDDLQRQLNQALDQALDALTNIWEEIGIVQEQRGARVEVVMEHVRGLLNAMVEEEESLKDKLMKNVERHGEELLRLCKELCRPPHEPPSGLTVLQLEKNLRTMVDRLNLEKHERLKMVKKLKEEDQHLCDILCTTPYYIPSGKIPSEDELKELRQHVEGLQQEKERRTVLFKNTKANIKRLLEDLERSPNSTFEKDVVLEEEDSFLLSSENMKSLKRLHDDLEQTQKENFSLATRLRDQLNSLWQRLRIPQEDREIFIAKHTGFRPKVIKALREEIVRCEQLKLDNLAIVIQGTRKELEEWWDKCYYSEQQKKQFRAFSQTEFTEPLLELHEAELEKIKEYYRKNQDMLEKVARRQQLWGEFLEFERKAADPMRFSNRGCNLLKEEKARKKLMRELPRVEQEVSEQIEDWEKKHGRAFLVGGKRFVDFIKVQWEDYKVNKEQEKNQRHIKKAKEMEEEILFGSKPVTPGKRRFIGTPAKTPTNKLRKLNPEDKDCSKTPVGAPRTDTPNPKKKSSSQSSLSSFSSTLSSSSRSSRYKKVPRYAKMPPPQMNDTTKTPMSSSRIHRTNFTSMYSPAVVPRNTGPKTPHRPKESTTTTRKALMEKTSNDTLFSHTTVAGNGHSTPISEGLPPAGPPTDVSSNSSVASIGPYHDFAKGINPSARPNCRSSVLPQPGTFL